VYFLIRGFEGRLFFESVLYRHVLVRVFLDPWSGTDDIKVSQVFMTEMNTELNYLLP
jgi:hypothetical protein